MLKGAKGLLQENVRVQLHELEHSLTQAVADHNTTGFWHLWSHAITRGFVVATKGLVAQSHLASDAKLTLLTSEKVRHYGKQALKKDSAFMQQTVDRGEIENSLDIIKH